MCMYESLNTLYCRDTDKREQQEALCMLLVVLINVYMNNYAVSCAN